ncbi:hypothetical protein [Nonomuraea dietziae]|uniref:hypothetical protein n=1 Tax=Nonomuraea dietziae TaxID=65515 RepID=UPI0033C995D8
MQMHVHPEDACVVPWCGRTWGYNRDNDPCAEPATHRPTDVDRAEALICDGHAIDARNRLIGGRVEPLPS